MHLRTFYTAARAVTDKMVALSTAKFRVHVWSSADSRHLTHY